MRTRVVLEWSISWSRIRRQESGWISGQSSRLGSLQLEVGRCASRLEDGVTAPWRQTLYLLRAMAVVGVAHLWLIHAPTV